MLQTFHAPRDETGSSGGPFLYRFENLSAFDFLVHAVFTRHGGTSLPPYDSLNTSYAVGDSPEAVSKNLEIIRHAVGASHLFFLNQVHGSGILVAGSGSFHGHTPPQADALITDRPGYALMVKQADCQSIVLLDPVKRVIANVHCGWRGNRDNIPGRAIRRMQSEFGCRPSEVIASVGPSLGPCCAEFKTHQELFPPSFRRFMVRKDYFDLWEISRWQLMEAGVRKANIELARICTRCRTDDFYSYRAEGVTGRFGTVAMLRASEKSGPKPGSV